MNLVLVDRKAPDQTSAEIKNFCGLPQFSQANTLISSYQIGKHIAVFWCVTPGILAKSYQRFEGTFHLHLQGRSFSSQPGFSEHQISQVRKCMHSITIRVHSFLTPNERVKAKSNVSSTDTVSPANSWHMVRTRVYVGVYLHPHTSAETRTSTHSPQYSVWNGAFRQVEIKSAPMNTVTAPS
jgi:hypothetical protein